MALESPKYCVLVCEDDPAMLRIFQFLLRQQGIHTVITATHGEHVTALAKQHKPALVLLDLMLPGKDGIAVLRDLKRDAATRTFPVIVVSGKEAHAMVQEAMTAGAIDYVIKPFDPMELGVRIKSFLDSQGESSVGPSVKTPPFSTGTGGSR